MKRFTTYFTICLFVLVSATLIISCAPPPLSDADYVEIERTNSFYTTFRVPNDQGDQVWQKAELWIRDHTKATFIVHTEVAMETELPDRSFSYKVTRSPGDNEWTFNVSARGRCDDQSWIDFYPRACYNAKALSRYLQTGEGARFVSLWPDRQDYRAACSQP